MITKEFDLKDIQDGLLKYPKTVKDDSIRILFTPRKITSQNLEQVCLLYSKIKGEKFDTVIVVEDSDYELKKRLPMSKFDHFETEVGEVHVNDKMRNELCDEDDDLFITNDGFNNDLCFFDQLLFLQSALTEFEFIQIQISRDERPAIVRELASVLAELHELRNTLLVFCCTLPPSALDEFNSIRHSVDMGNISQFLNTIFADDSNLKGRGAFSTGFYVSNSWGLDISFIPIKNEGDSLITAYAHHKLV